VVKAKFCQIRQSSLLDEGDRAINNHDTNLATKTVSGQTVRMKEKRGKVVKKSIVWVGVGSFLLQLFQEKTLTLA